jgi:hypothetical protein
MHPPYRRKKKLEVICDRSILTGNQQSDTPIIDRLAELQKNGVGIVFASVFESADLIDQLKATSLEIQEKNLMCWPFGMNALEDFWNIRFKQHHKQDFYIGEFFQNLKIAEHYGVRTMCWNPHSRDRFLEFEQFVQKIKI